MKSNPARRIYGITYHQCKPSWARLRRTRFSPYLSPVATLFSPLRGNRIPSLVRSFVPEAVITVVWGYAWVAAAAYAQHAGLPLHLIFHDHSPDAEGWGRLERQLIDQRLRYWYPKAASRLCISPYMVEEYRRRYGADGDVLYPSRAAGDLTFAEPPETLAGACAPFTVAFGGSVNTEYARALRRIAVALRAIGGRLIVYGPTLNAGASSFLQECNIEKRERVNPRQFIEECRREVHAMLVPMSYRGQDRANMEISFPSKLADSTAVGIPLIIDGPEYCSAVRWARENPGVAEVITDQTADALAGALKRLQEPAHRFRLATAAIHRGARYFSSDRAICTLHSKLRRVPRSPEHFIEADRCH